LKIAQEVRARQIEGIALIQLGVITGKEDLSRIEEARGTIQQGISILEELKLIPSLGIGYIFLGELLIDADRKDEARESLKKAETMYQEMEVTPQSYWLKRTQEALAKLQL
jgi:tetratricopeptide (TPR) repeat protein